MQKREKGKNKKWKFRNFRNNKNSNQKFTATFDYITKREAQWRHKRKVRITPRANRHRPRCLRNSEDRFSGPQPDHPKKSSPTFVDFYRVDCLARFQFRQCQIQVSHEVQSFYGFLENFFGWFLCQILINIFLTNQKQFVANIKAIFREENNRIISHPKGHA